MALLGPIVMVSCELVVPQLFPCGQWISQAWNPLVIQVSELTGPFGVTALLMMINGAAYDLTVNVRAGRYPAMASAACWRRRWSSARCACTRSTRFAAHAPLLKVGVVQPNFAYTIDGDSRATRHCAS